jgi:predicted nucleic acid-binding protein
MRWARLLSDLRASGRTMPIKDSMIAATALGHELVVVTRNGADFEKAGVDVIDPFESKRRERRPSGPRTVATLFVSVGAVR